MNQWVDVKCEVDSNLSWQYVNKDDQGWWDPKLKCMHLIRENLMVCYGRIHPADLWLKKAAPFPFFYLFKGPIVLALYPGCGQSTRGRPPTNGNRRNSKPGGLEKGDGNTFPFMFRTAVFNL